MMMIITTTTTTTIIIIIIIIKTEAPSITSHHHRLYSPGCALASLSKCRQRPLSWASDRQFLQQFPCVSPSIHLDFGRPSPPSPPGFVHSNFLDNSFSSIRTWSAHHSLLDFITLTMFGSL